MWVWGFFNVYIYIILFVNMYKCLRNTCIDLRLDYISLLKKKKIETLGFNLV